LVVHSVLLFLLVVASAWAVVTRDLLRSAIALAFASVFLTIIFFQLKAPLAGAFELSVAAGLVTVLFVSAISLVAGAREGEPGE
jgi:NADH-quinone oxidoreductase subunit J